MNDKGNRYALAALKDKRASLASEIIQLERQIRHRKEALVHVDATLRLLDPDLHVEGIPNKRSAKRIKLFRQGELGRLILGAIREAEKPLHASEIVSAIIKAGGHGDGARHALAQRVRTNLAYLSRNNKVSKQSSGRDASWALSLQD
jgi:hypothetical protein